MTVKEFLDIRDEGEILKVKSIKEGIKGRNFIGGYRCKKFIDYACSKVWSIKKYHSDGNIYYLCSLLLGIGRKELEKRPYTDLIYFLKYVEEELNAIANLESGLNKMDDGDAEVQMKLEAAGISEMSKFEELNIVDDLAGGDMLKWKLIERMPYKMVYIKLLKNKTYSGVQKRFQEMNKKTR